MNATFRGSNGKKEFISLIVLSKRCIITLSRGTKPHFLYEGLKAFTFFLNIYIETGEEPLRHEAFPDFSPHAAELSGKFSFGRI